MGPAGMRGAAGTPRRRRLRTGQRARPSRGSPHSAPASRAGGRGLVGEVLSAEYTSADDPAPDATTSPSLGMGDRSRRKPGRSARAVSTCRRSPRGGGRSRAERTGLGAASRRPDQSARATPRLRSTRWPPVVGDPSAGGASPLTAAAAFLNGPSRLGGPCSHGPGRTAESHWPGWLQAAGAVEGPGGRERSMRGGLEALGARLEDGKRLAVDQATRRTRCRPRWTDALGAHHLDRGGGAHVRGRREPPVF